MRILILDDERQITRLLRTSMESSEYEVSVANSGAEALELFEAVPPDLVITDPSMPEMDGLELTRAFRKNSDVPILVLSVREQEAMKVAALDAGADDYMSKPFSMPELMARVRADLRRSRSPETKQMHIEAGDFVIDSTTHSVCVRSAEMHLTPKEFDLLLLFARNPERVLSHKLPLRSIWGPAGEDQPEYLRVLVAQLRKKIEERGESRYIRSEPWVGYRFLPNGSNTVGEHSVAEE